VYLSTLEVLKPGSHSPRSNVKR